MAVTQEIPQNVVRSITHTVSETGLFPLFEKLHGNHNVLRIEHERSGANFKVTVHYSVMDLALKLVAVATSIEQSFVEAKDNASVRS